MTSPGPRGDTIEVKGLTKHFGEVKAVRGLDFSVPPGRVTGFLGPNGAGKTTTLRILLGLVAPSSGSATIGNRRYRDLDDPIRRVGAVLEATSFHPSRRARDHLLMMAIPHQIPSSRVDEVLGLVGLSDDAHRKVGGFSMGMRQRLELAGALLGDPGVLILDEPSNGLDPQGIVWMRDLLRHLASEGRTILISSHLLAEMSQTVDDVVILAQGEVQAQGPLSSLSDQLRSSMRVRTPEADRLLGVLRATPFTAQRLAPDVVVVEGANPEDLGPVLATNQIVVYELAHEKSTLESVFLSLTSGTSPTPTSTDPKTPTTWSPPTGPPVADPRAP
jgi:ABC-2 type transport system ATP-binding protein